jgi:hypothetical protein
MSAALLAQKMFEAYNEHGPNPWKTFDGRAVPRWQELNDQVRDKWIAAAEEAKNELSIGEARVDLAVAIIVNGEDKSFSGPIISYADVVALAFPVAPEHSVLERVGATMKKALRQQLAEKDARIAELERQRETLLQSLRAAQNQQPQIVTIPVYIPQPQPVAPIYPWWQPLGQPDIVWCDPLVPTFATAPRSLGFNPPTLDSYIIRPAPDEITISDATNNQIAYALKRDNAWQPIDVGTGKPVMMPIGTA